MKLDVKSTRNRTIIDFSKVGLKELVVLGKYNYNKAGPNLEDHKHADMIEICYYDKGSQWFVVNNKRWLVRGGDVFIHFPGEVHGSGEYPEAKGCLYWFIIKTGYPANIRTNKTNTSLLVNELMKIKRRHFRGERIIKKMLEEIFSAVKENKEPPQIRQIRIKLCAESFLLKLIELANKKTNNTDNERLQKVYELIDKRLTENLSIAILAREANLSESRFKNWFKELSGFTPADFVQRKRVDFAIAKLKSGSSINLKDLAYDLNFSSQQYFTMVVKKFTGKSPKEWKRSD